jgi:ribosomal protein S18 acetylase RimI-like enzyme
LTGVVRILPVDIRPADGFADWEGLLALLRRAFAFMEGRIDPPSSLHRLDAAGLAAKARAGWCLLASRGGRLAGCVFCEPHADCLYVGKLAVEPGLQGQGIGRALLERAEAEAMARGLPALELQTRIELVENLRAFERLGFRRTGETAHPGYGRPTSITMRKAVG